MNLKKNYPEPFSLDVFSFLIVFLLIIGTDLNAEGTKELAPSNTDRVYLYTNSTAYNEFGRYDGADDQRLYIHIEDSSSEQILMGFSRPVSSGHYPCNGATSVNGYFRIKDPTGRVVYPIIDNPNGQILNDITSNITSYNQAVIGPASIGGAGGYIPFVFDPAGLPSGDYYIEFSRVINTASLNNPIPIELFDITVATKDVFPSAKTGRVFAKNWALFAPSVICGADPSYTWFDREFNGGFFVYTDQNIVTEVDFNNAGFQPAAFNVVFNDAGTTKTNDVQEDRKSRNDLRSSASQHRIFLNDPDINIYPSGVLGQFSVTPNYIVCDNGTACVEGVMTEPGQIDVLIDLDRASGDFIYDLNSRDVLISFKVAPVAGETKPYKRCVPWDGVDGLGVKVQNIDQADILVRYTQGIYHFPIYDAEYMLTGFDVTTIRPIPNNGSPKKVYYDDINIPDLYGLGINGPKQNPFNGCNLPCHPWTSSAFGDFNTINTWFFAREEYVLQIELGDCPISAQNDTTRTPVNTLKSLQVLTNDLGTENIDTTSISVGVTPLNGVVTFDSISLLTNYQPNPSFIGLDSFTYIFCYGILPVRSLCDSATVFVTVFSTPENCNNIFDDDGDGLADCDDPDCLSVGPNIQRKRENKE